jgi:hypothetical protein
MSWRPPFAAILAFGLPWHAHGAADSPYSGQETREIKALSKEELSVLLVAGEGTLSVAGTNRNEGLADLRNRSQ